MTLYVKQRVDFTFARVQEQPEQEQREQEPSPKKSTYIFTNYKGMLCEAYSDTT